MRNLASQGSTIYISSDNSNVYLFNNYYTKNVAATIPQSRISTVTSYNSNLGIGNGIIIILYSCFIKIFLI